MMEDRSSNDGTDEDSSDSNYGVATMSSYEKMIEEKRAEKMAILQSIGIDEAKADFFEVMNRKLKPVKRSYIKKEYRCLLPPRKSRRRLVKVGFDYSEKKMFDKAFLFGERNEVKKKHEVPKRKSSRLANFNFNFSEKSLFKDFQFDEESENEMRLKRKVKTNTHSSDPDLPRDMGNETEAAISSGKRGATNLELIKINGFTFGSSGKKLKEVASETSQKIMRKIPENEVSSQSNPVSMKELQIKLKRCNVLPVGVEQTIEVVDGAEQQNERSKNTNGSSKKRSRNNVKKMNSVPEAAGSVHAEDEFPDVHINKNVQIHSEKLEGVQQNIEAMKSCEDLELPIDVTEVVKHVPNQTGKGNKRKRGRRKSEEKSDDDVKPARSAKKEKDSDKSKSSREEIPDVTAIDFSNDSKSSSGNVWNFKVSSWNVNGIRAWLEKASIDLSDEDCCDSDSDSSYIPSKQTKEEKRHSPNSEETYTKALKSEEELHKDMNVQEPESTEKHLSCNRCSILLCDIESNFCKNNCFPSEMPVLLKRHL